MEVKKAQPERYLGRESGVHYSHSGHRACCWLTLFACRNDVPGGNNLVLGWENELADTVGEDKMMPNEIQSPGGRSYGKCRFTLFELERGLRTRFP